MAWLGNIFGGAGGNNGGGEFVGQYVDLGKQKLRIKRVIAEGKISFAFMYPGSMGCLEKVGKNELFSIDNLLRLFKRNKDLILRLIISFFFLNFSLYLTSLLLIVRLSDLKEWYAVRIFLLNMKKIKNLKK